MGIEKGWQLVCGLPEGFVKWQVEVEGEHERF